MQDLWKLMRQVAGVATPIAPSTPGTPIASTPSAGGGGQWLKAAVSDSRFAMTNRTTTTTATNIRVATTHDFNNWVTYTPSGVIVSDICWSGTLGKFLVTSNTANTAVLHMSATGSSWTTATVSTHRIFNVAWSPTLGLFAAVGQNSSTSDYVAMTSPDGINWTQRQTLAINYSSPSSAMIWVPTIALFVFMGVNTASSLSPHLLTSPDGINWTARSNAARGARDLTYSPAQNRIVGSGTSAGAPASTTSTDGITWTPGTQTFGASGLTCVAWDEAAGLFKGMAVISGIGYVYTSNDGLNWTQTLNLGAMSSFYYSLTYVPWVGQCVVTRPVSASVPELVFV